MKFSDDIFTVTWSSFWIHCEKILIYKQLYGIFTYHLFCFFVLISKNFLHF